MGTQQPVDKISQEITENFNVIVNDILSVGANTLILRPFK